MELLRNRLQRFAAQIEPERNGRLTARIPAVGRIELLLTYQAGDEEFPPAAELLFDACCKRVYGAEDAAVLGSRVCLGCSDPTNSADTRDELPAHRVRHGMGSRCLRVSRHPTTGGSKTGRSQDKANVSGQQRHPALPRSCRALGG